MDDAESSFDAIAIGLNKGLSSKGEMLNRQKTAYPVLEYAE